ncbi:MAG: hypothetical protein CME06_08770 [Gemmatimonadetes bacterium]|nr:hypothetical protein [Gemmatimonadota bacterium]
MAFLIAEIMGLGFDVDAATISGIRWFALPLLVLFFSAGISSCLKSSDALQWARRQRIRTAVLIAAGISLVSIVARILQGYLDHAHVVTAFAEWCAIGASITQLARVPNQLSDWSRDKAGTLRIEPARELGVSFLCVIAFGTLLLLGPASTTPATRLSPIDALFTATSATCVTGLTVRDTSAVARE